MLPELINFNFRKCLGSSNSVLKRTFSVLILPVYNPIRNKTINEIKSFNYMSKRGRRIKFKNWPNDFLPFQWTKPERMWKHELSGDRLEDNGPYDENVLKLGCSGSKKLENAPDIIRRQFTLGWASFTEIRHFQEAQLLKKLARHPFDDDSPEALIVRYTVRIRDLKKYLAIIEEINQERNMRRVQGYHRYLRDKRIDQFRRLLRYLINDRNTSLIELAGIDKTRYEKVLEVLMLDHELTEPGVGLIRIERKDQLRKLTKKYCEDLKREKLEAYHAKLLKEQEKFVKKKAEISRWISDEEKFLGTAVDSTTNVP